MSRPQRLLVTTGNVLAEYKCMSWQNASGTSDREWAQTSLRILSDDCAHSRSHAALLSLALSCKTFHETAIRCTWSNLHELSPLIRCFPEDVWTIEETGELKIVRSLVPDDWKSFLRHSPYVRHLGKLWDDVAPRHLQLGSGILTSLLTYRSVLVLFPRLVELTWSTLRMDDNDLPAMLGLMGPHVKRISISCWSLEYDTKQYLLTSLSLISTRFPSLQHFVLRSMDPPAVCRLIPGTLLSNLHDLRAFRCHDIPITEGAFSVLGRLQYLSELSIRLPILMSWPPLPPNAFPLLREVTITARTKDCLAFSAAISKLSTKVEDAAIILRDVPQPQDGLRFFSAVSMQFPHSLAELSIYTSDNANMGLGRPQDKMTVTQDHMHRRLSFTVLKTLGVNLACQYTLNGEFLADIAMALPEIESLHIGAFKHCIHDIAVNALPIMVETLAPFATHCRHLFSLGIPFDARQNLTVGDVKDAIADRPSKCPVTDLDCTHCLIGDGNIVAAYIARVFPMLDGGWDLHFSLFPQLGSEEEWLVVRLQLPWFKMIREDERGGTERIDMSDRWITIY